MDTYSISTEFLPTLVRVAGTGLSRRFMQQTAQLKKTAQMLQTALATEAEEGDSAVTKRALSKVAVQLETTAQLDCIAAPPTPTDPEAKWRQVQAAGFAAIRRVNSAPMLAPKTASTGS